MANGQTQRQALSSNITANHLSLLGGSVNNTALCKHGRIARNYSSYMQGAVAISWTLMNLEHTLTTYFFEIRFNIILSSISRSPYLFFTLPILFIIPDAE
jgi:hypothetical protein